MNWIWFQQGTKKLKMFKFMLHCICDDILGTLRDFWDGGTTESMSGGFKRQKYCR